MRFVNLSAHFSNISDYANSEYFVSWEAGRMRVVSTDGGWAGVLTLIAKPHNNLNASIAPQAYTLQPKTPGNYIKIARPSFGVAHALKSKGR